MIAWLFSPLGRIIGGLGAILVFLGVFALDQQSRGKSKLIAESKQQGKKINAKNAQVFDRAQRPGAPERVRKKFCRDC